MLSYVLSYWREAAIGLLVVFVLGACHARDNALRDRGRALERWRVADSTLHVVRPALLRVETKLVHDTVRVRVAVDRLVTFRDTVLRHLTDTLLVKQYVTRADSAAKACTELAGDCVAFKAYATQTIAALESEVSAAPAAASRSCVAQDLLVGLASGLAGYVAHRR